MKEKGLSLSQRKEYINNIRDLEVSCYQQQSFISMLQSKMESLVAYISAEPPFASLGAEIVDLISIIVATTLFGCGIGAVLSVGAKFIGREMGTFFSVAVKGAWIGGGIGVVLCIFEIIGWISSKKEYKKEINDVKTQVQALTEVLAHSKEKLEDTTGILNQYYDMGYIYNKYRGMVPICSICEYFESGRCFTFEGPHGAYNLYEEEVRSNLIIDKLDKVIERLDRLNDGQQMLARLIRESNDKIDRLSCAIDDMGLSMMNIERNTALSTYYDRITSENAAHISWVTTWQSSFQ